DENELLILKASQSADTIIPTLSNNSQNYSNYKPTNKLLNVKTFSRPIKFSKKIC
ncbi:5016_t:CDS:1, partial [Dentiscutata heterogama]